MVGSELRATMVLFVKDAVDGSSQGLDFIITAVSRLAWPGKSPNQSLAKLKALYVCGQGARKDSIACWSRYFSDNDVCKYLCPDELGVGEARFSRCRRRPLEAMLFELLTSLNQILN